MTKLPDRYNPQATEKKQQKIWAEKQIYKWQNDLPKAQTFVIDTPPPTVSGLLHMGHIFSYTQADFIARYKRMRGFDVFYPMGFDDNGLPTERLVEKTIGKKAGAYEAENGQGSFVAKCREIVEEAEKEFESLFNTIALSVDWKQKYQTISPESQKISQASFIDLFNKGLVERKFEPVFWDVVDRTALAQADLVDKEIDGMMNEIEFEVDDSSKYNGINSENKDWIAASPAAPRNDGVSNSFANISITPGNDGVSNSFANLATRHCEELCSVAIQKNINKITIMTTRPELLPACVAVMVHPEDERYEHLFKNIEFGRQGFTGSFAITPIFKVRVPIIADDLVQKDKGTGAVMCCTFGDETDIKWWRKWGLKTMVIIGEDGRFNWEACKINGRLPQGSDYLTAIDDLKLCDDVSGKTLKEAKEIIIKSLKNKLLKQTPIKHSVKCAERSGMPIEILVTNQWFIKILDKKEQLKAKARECNWHPEYMRIRVEQWIDGLSWDWCISRQRFFGVAFPVWYSKRKDEEGTILVATIEQLQKATDENRAFDPKIDLPIDPANKNGTGFYGRDEVEAETDIMDTWATSSISPQLSSKGISDEICFDEQRHNKLFPADLRPQAHEIIRSWAFYTIVKSMLHQDQIPWQNLMISGWCLAADKTKMSKSKGNVITPQSLIEEKGADVVRYWASASNLGADIAYSEELFKIGSKLITKLFNASKFASLHFEGQNFGDLKSTPINPKQDIVRGTINQKADLWILSRLQQIIKKAEEEYEQFEYAKARQAIEDFFWNDFCDNYLEIVKVRSYGLQAEKYKDLELSEEQKSQIISNQQSGLFALYHCLEALLKLFAPFLPHITEELYQSIFPNKLDSIHQRGSWCKLENYILDEEALELGKIMLEVIFNVRKFKSDNNLSMKTVIESLTINTTKDISEIIPDLQNVCNAKEILIRKDTSSKQLAVINA